MLITRPTATLDFTQHRHFQVWDTEGLLKTVTVPETNDFFADLFEAVTELEADGFHVLAQARQAFAVRKAV